LKEWWWNFLISGGMSGYALDKYSEIEARLRDNGGKEDIIQLKERLLRSKNLNKRR
jgi:hypothetical protein